MRELIAKNLSTKIDAAVVASLLETYRKMVAERRKGGVEECLTQAGKFVEHTLRAVEHIRTGVVVPEIKYPAETIKSIEKDKTLPESLRILVPKVAHSMVYELRSKRGAVHVKEIDPREIDAALCVQAASWVIAELLRLYHADAEEAVAEAMAALMRVEMPLIETLGGEVVVTAKVPCAVELLLLVGRCAPIGIDRKALGESSKNLSSTVSKTLQRLDSDRLVHKAVDGRFHITGPGERRLNEALAGYSH